MKRYFTKNLRFVLLVLSTLSIAITAYPDPSGIQNKLAFGREEVVPIDEDQWKRIENGTWIFEDNIGQFRVSIDAGIVIINATEDRIEGKVVDSNGNLLDMYDRESVIMATFGYDSKRNTQTYTTIPQQGTFAIEIPEEYSDADYVKLWVNGNTYTIKAPKLPLPEKEYFSTTKDIIEQSNGTASAEIAITNATHVTITTSQNGNNTTILTIVNTTATTTIEIINAVSINVSQNATTANTSITNATSIVTTTTTTEMKSMPAKYVVGQGSLTISIEENETFKVKGPLLTVALFGKTTIKPEPWIHQPTILVTIDQTWHTHRLNS